MPASPSTARAINDRLALRLLQQEGPLTAGQLKQLTGLSRPTVADLVERLTASGLIDGGRGGGRAAARAERQAVRHRRRPRPSRRPRRPDRGRLRDRLRPARPGPRRGLRADRRRHRDRTCGRAGGRAGRTGGEGGRAPTALHTVGIGAPGLIDPATGELRDSSGLPEWHRRLVAALQERLPEARVSVENETNLAALAEQRDGAARDRDTFVLLWLGHGTGAAVVLDGALRRGASGGTGEIGFLPVPGTPGTALGDGLRGRIPLPGGVGGDRGTGARAWRDWRAGTGRGRRAGRAAVAGSREAERPTRAGIAVRRPGRPAVSSTPSPTDLPSVSPPWWRSSTPDAWCWAARSARPAGTNSPAAWPNGSGACHRCPPRSGRAPSVGVPYFAGHCSPHGTELRTTCSLLAER